MTPTLIDGLSDVSAVLADPAYQVPPAPAPAEGETGTLAWLRANVARFSEGPDHQRRRGLALADLAAIDPRVLRDGAAALTAAEIGRSDGQPFDVMRLARRVPLAVLAEALGVPADVTAAVADAAMAVGPAYLNPDLAGEGTDDAVATLIRHFGPDATEATANRIGLLMQACDATAGLIGNSVVRAFATGSADGPGAVRIPDDDDVDAVVAATVRDDPPVRRTRRVAPDGEIVLVDLTRQTFGTGRRPCPGPDHAMALATGVVQAILRSCDLADPHVDYPEPGNLRMPASLIVQAVSPRD